MRRSKNFHAILVLFELLVLWVHRGTACAIGSVSLEECGAVGEPTTVRANVYGNCYFMVIIKWGDLSVGYPVNSTDEDASALLQHNYSAPGDYSIDAIIRGYENPLPENFDPLFYPHIEAMWSDTARVAIRENSCKELPISAAEAPQTGFYIMHVAALLIAWFLL